MFTYFRLCIRLFLLVIISHSVIAQRYKARIDSLIQTEFGDTTGPGGVFLVAKGGHPIYHKSFGKANLELGVNLAPDAVFQIGSMTKQFTAVAVLMLQEQGKLNVLDPIAKYLPDYPAGDKITIHQLLTHTSGIKDFTTMKSLSTVAQQEMSPKMMVDFFKNEPVDFLPGEKFAYNNSGYVLLGYLIELVSGETYESFIDTHIFKRVGMSQSSYASDRRVIHHRAYGYQKKKEGYVNKTAIHFSVPFSSGSLMATASDLLKWQNALTQNLLLSPQSSQQAFRSYQVKTGQDIEYGYGWHLRTINNTPTREHGGSIFGFKSMGVYIPSADIYVVGLSNCDCHSPTKLTQAIAELVLKATQQD